MKKINYKMKKINYKTITLPNGETRTYALADRNASLNYFNVMRELKILGIVL